MAVWVFNNSSHQFSELPPQLLICNPAEMHEVRKEDYMKKFHHYIDMNPYYRVSKLFHKGIRPYAHPGEYFIVEVDKQNKDMRYKYKRFEKGADRHLYDAEPRQIKYIMGNKFILEGIM